MKNGQRHACRALVESYRTASGPRQRVVAWLGKLDEAGRLGVKHAADDAKKSDAKTALPDLPGVAKEQLDENRLYRGLDQRLPHKEAPGVHLKNRLGGLFQLEYDVLLYDVTSTYFEGAADFPLAQRGYSRDR